MEKLKNLTEDNSELKKIIDYGYEAKNTHGFPGIVFLISFIKLFKEKIICKIHWRFLFIKKEKIEG